MNIYETITQRIITQLESGVIPWRKEWKNTSPKSSRLPVNFATGKPYRGANVITLLCSMYDDQRWMTYKQAQTLGYQVRRGEKASPIVFWKFDKRTNTKGEEYNVAFARAYSVFNVSQIDGIDQTFPLPFDAPAFDPIAEADAIVDGYMTSDNHPSLAHGGDRAYYAPLRDAVQMPPRESFSTPHAYYATLFHEFAHSTGHTSRLDRKEGMSNKFGDGEYSREELLAEFTSAFLCAESGCSNDALLTNSTAYIQAWLRELKNDSTLAVIAAQRAQKAADYIIRRSATNAIETTEETAA